MYIAKFISFNIFIQIVYKCHVLGKVSMDLRLAAWQLALKNCQIQLFRIASHTVFFKKIVYSSKCNNHQHFRLYGMRKFNIC